MRAQLTSNMAEALDLPVLEPLSPEADVPPVVLNRATCVVGARSRVHLPLPAKEVSKAHALIVRDQDGVYIRDLSSRNSTFVNDSPVREKPLDESDVIKIGRFEFRCASGFRHHSEATRHPESATLKVDGSGRIPLAQRTAVIGSRADCEIQIFGDAVSPAHAVIFERNGQRYVRDLDSVGGTYLNGELVREQQLRAGDEIRVADTPIYYVIGDEDNNEGIEEHVHEKIAVVAHDEAPQAADAGEELEPIALDHEPDELAVLSQAQSLPIEEAAQEQVPVVAAVAPTPIAPAPADAAAQDESLDDDWLIPLAGDEPAAPAQVPTPVAQSSEPVAKTLEVAEPQIPSPHELPEDQAPIPQDEDLVADDKGTDDIEINLSEESIDPKVLLAAHQAESAPALVAASVSPKEAEVPAPEKLTQLVGEISEKAQELEVVWRDFQEHTRPEHSHPGSEHAFKDWQEDAPSNSSKQKSLRPGEAD